MCWTTDGLFGKPYDLPVTCVPASASALRSSWMQLCSSSDARRRLAVKGCNFCGWDTQQVSGAGVAGQAVGQEGSLPTRSRRKRRKSSARPEQGIPWGTRLKPRRKGAWRWTGSHRQEQSEAGRRGLPSCARGSPSPSPLLGFPVTFPGMSVRHEAAVGTEGHRGEVRRWLTA